MQEEPYLGDYNYQKHPTIKGKWVQKSTGHIIHLREDGGWSHVAKNKTGRDRVTSGHGHGSLYEHLEDFHADGGGPASTQHSESYLPTTFGEVAPPIQFREEVVEQFGEGDYHLFMSGGSIGGGLKGSRHPTHGQYVSRHASKEEADDKAKRMNGRLSAGEKQYYKIKYHVKHTNALGGWEVPV